MRRRLSGSAARSLSTATQAELIDALDRGEQPALSELYRRHGAVVFAVASNLVAADLAEAVTRTVFLRLWSAPNAFQETGESLRQFLVSGARAESVALLAGNDDQPSPPGIERVVSLLGTLPAEQATAMALVGLGDCSFKQAAQILDERESDVRHRTVVGLRALRTAGEH